MKTITLQEAFDILEDCAAVIIDYTVTYPELDEIRGEEENEFLYLGWDDSENEFYAKFREKENQSVKVIGAILHLIDHEGDEVPITILYPKSLE